MRSYQPVLMDPQSGDFTPGVDELTAELQKQAETVHDGDMRRAETMLVAQAHALQAIFAHFAERARTADSLDLLQGLLGLALKAQAQCRSTLETLVDVKFPRLTQFVRQQNVAANQQVNNGGQDTNAPQARGKNAESTIELLPDGTTHERLDPATPGSTGASNPNLEALAQLNRA